MSRSLAVRQAAPLATMRDVIDQLAARDRNGELLTAVRHIPAREAQWAPMPDWVRPELAAAYRDMGVERLYSHQTRAGDLAGAHARIDRCLSVQEGLPVVRRPVRRAGRTRQGSGPADPAAIGQHGARYERQKPRV
jgi:hypothetical protein